MGLELHNFLWLDSRAEFAVLNRDINSWTRYLDRLYFSWYMLRKEAVRWGWEYLFLGMNFNRSRWYRRIDRAGFVWKHLAVQWEKVHHSFVLGKLNIACPSGFNGHRKIYIALKKNEGFYKLALIVQHSLLLRKAPLKWFFMIIPWDKWLKSFMKIVLQVFSNLHVATAD